MLSEQDAPTLWILFIIKEAPLCIDAIYSWSYIHPQLNSRQEV